MAILSERKKVLNIVFISVLIFNIFFNFFQPIESLIFNIVRLPLTVHAYFIKEMRSIVFYRMLIRQNSVLKDKTAQLQSKIIESDEVLGENKRLKKLLELKESSEFSLISANVIARENYLGNQIIIIDIGSNFNIKQNQAVVTYLGLVGKIIQVNSNVAKVMLINNPNLSVAVLMQDSRQQGLLQGSFHGKCKIRYLDRDAEIKKGDVVVTSGLGSMFPEGIMVGRVLSVGREIGEDLQYAVLKPEVDLSRVEEVFVVEY